MKIASWNVNSLTVRLTQTVEWLTQSQVDILCVQELKMESHKFPEAAFNNIGYHSIWSGQKTYNGVAILSKLPMANVQINNPLYPDEQQRFIATDITTQHGTLRLINVYCPNGSELGSEKFSYKMAWFDALNKHIKNQLQQSPLLVLTGDFNIAPSDADIHEKYSGELLISPAERQQFEQLIASGLHDSFRLFRQTEKSFSWWDYRHFAFKRNAGLRIDHVLISDALVPHCLASTIDKTPRYNERPSDHTPVIATLDV